MTGLAFMLRSTDTETRTTTIVVYDGLCDTCYDSTDVSTESLGFLIIASSFSGRNTQPSPVTLSHVIPSANDIDPSHYN